MASAASGRFLVRWRLLRGQSDALRADRLRLVFFVSEPSNVPNISVFPAS